MAGYARPISPTSRTMTAVSVAGCFKNLSRAGVLKNSRLTLTRVPAGLPTGPLAICAPPSTSTRYPSPPSPGRLTASTRAPAAILASASPRNPSVWIVRRSSSEWILLVACRRNASGRSTGAIPIPSSTTSIRRCPAPSMPTWIRDAPASIAFSTSSLTTAAGRSTTSPAAMPSATAVGRMEMRASSRPASVRDMLSLPGVELFQGLPRRQALEVELLEFGDHRVIQWQAELRIRIRRCKGSLTLQLREHLARPHHDLARKAGELGDMNAVAAVRAALHDLVQEDDALTFLAHFHPEVVEARQSLGQRGQLVVMGREERQRAQLRRVMKVLEDRLRDAHPVVSARAAADLVEDKQAAGRRVGEDVGGLDHLDHEGRQPSGQLIVRADAGEDPVTETDDGAGRWNEAPHLRQQHDDAGLAQVGRLSGYVRPAQQNNLLIVRVEPQVIGDEATGPQGGLHQRVTATDDLDPRRIAQDGSHPVVTRRHRAQRRDGIELPEPGGGVEQVLTGGGDAAAELAEERLLPRHHRALGVEDQRLLLLELGRDVALAVHQGLLAYVLRGDRLAVRMADLEVVAEHLVEPDLQRPDAGPLALGLFQGGDPVAGGPRSVSKAIELGIEPGLEDTTVFQRRRNLVDQRRYQELPKLVLGW